MSIPPSQYTSEVDTSPAGERLESWKEIAVSDATRVFFLRHTTRREWAELTSIGVRGGAERAYGLVGPFERDFVISMDVSPRDELVYVTHREGSHELWLANLR